MPVSSSLAYMQALPKKRVGALVLLRSAADEVVLVRTAYGRRQLQLVGGTAEEGESPWAACVRELGEETGLVLYPGRLLVVDYVAGTPGHSTEGLNFVFDGGTLTDRQISAITLPPQELSEVVCVPPADLVQRAPAQQRRITAALAALRGSTHIYLENGHPLPLGPTWHHHP